MVTVKCDGKQHDIQTESGFNMDGLLSSGERGMSPIELLSSSLGLCISISLKKLLDRDGFDTHLVFVNVKSIKAEDSPSRIESFDIQITLPEELDAAYKYKLQKSAERACTIGNTLKAGSSVHYEVM